MSGCQSSNELDAVIRQASLDRNPRPWLHLMQVPPIGLEDSNPVLNLMLYFDCIENTAESGWLKTSGRDELDSLLQKFYSNPHISRLLQQTPVSIGTFVSPAG